jgi:hypothetical protein
MQHVGPGSARPNVKRASVFSSNLRFGEERTAACGFLVVQIAEEREVLRGMFANYVPWIHVVVFHDR